MLVPLVLSVAVKRSGPYPVLKKGQFLPEQIVCEPENAPVRPEYKSFVVKLQRPGFPNLELGSFMLLPRKDKSVEIAGFFPFFRAQIRAEKTARERGRVFQEEQFWQAVKRKGVGRIVLAKAEEFAIQMGAERVKLHPFVQAPKFFHSQGYRYRRAEGRWSKSMRKPWLGRMLGQRQKR